MTTAPLEPTGVFAGAAVTAQVTPNMTVAVAAGTATVAGTSATIAAGNVTIAAADTTYDRIDAIVVNSSGTKSVIQGTTTEAGTVLPPDTTGYLALSYVTVYARNSPAFTGTITSEAIEDLREYVTAITTVPGQIWLSSAGMWPSITAGAANNLQVEMATNDQNVYVIDFGNLATESAECNLVMPSDYDGGTITAYFVFIVNAAVSTGVVWSLQCRSYADAEALDQAWGTSQKIAETLTGTANRVCITSATPAITPGGTPAASELMLFRVSRLPLDASDTTVSDARLLGCMVQFTRA